MYDVRTPFEWGLFSYSKKISISYIKSYRDTDNNQGPFVGGVEWYWIWIRAGIQLRMNVNMPSNTFGYCLRY